MVDADHGRQVVAHGVHGVVALVTMKGPVTLLVGDKLDLAHLAHGDVRGHLGPARRRRHRPAVRAGHLELVAVQVDGVVGHGQVADAHPHPVVQADVQCIDPREDPAVPAPQVEIEHGHDPRGVAARLDVIGVEQEDKIPVHRGDQRVVLPRVGHPGAHHAHGHLGHLVGVGVVHEGAGPARREFVDKGLARPDRRLGEAGDAVHAVGQPLPVPVDAGVLGQPVGDKDAHPVTLHHLDGRARALAVVAPEMGFQARRHLPHHRLGHQVELLGAPVHAPRQGPAVEGHHRAIGPTGGWAERRHGCGLGLHHRIGQGGQGNAVDQGRGHGAAGQTGRLQKGSSRGHRLFSCGLARLPVSGPPGHPGQPLPAGCRPAAAPVCR